jgi:hypothetical protein
MISRRHNHIEHDASLSRLDFAQGNNSVFDENVYKDIYRFTEFNDARVAWYLSLDGLAEFIKFRQMKSKETHPDTYDFGVKYTGAAMAEAAILYLIFRDDTDMIRMEWIGISEMIYF